MEPLKINIATPAEVEDCLAILTLAFCSDPAFRWMFPQPSQYAQGLPLFAQAFGGEAFHQATAFYTEEFGAVALWLPPNTQPNESALMAFIQQGVEESQQLALDSILEQLDGYHPQVPHWHLALIGTDPICQGQGYGSALLAHTLRICDQQQELVYLEATNARNVALYQKHGFEMLGTVQVGNSPILYPMLRHPQ
ncbi:N-acetyltransferase [Acaryochloris sp. IP29b_bin.137]|uniref:GNAT family N-acetyltransferase n=1 Tax=Acaryochloris sp. IP29b_bin.137 TaxID=2969217 RepID=UPI002630094A|nr:N-acetyltransferase [Acaryochloris sp. IP29b_bin.137]